MPRLVSCKCHVIYYKMVSLINVVLLWETMLKIAGDYINHHTIYIAVETVGSVACFDSDRVGYSHCTS